ncbi:UMF1 family MFS transporter [Parvibaculum indicum]|uniref:MFS transporter n=1 Tax=Parvibaculum indicum TaxID=562969 RepID=UPI0014228B14|nr:MFS transporter [Parvibaculum indicum]NIJ43358.1 UMF1 family MFS transporter [Parvibaculum indicum]
MVDVTKEAGPAAQAGRQGAESFPPSGHDGHSLSATGDRAADKKGQVSWAVFEWARNPYVLLITIYIFSPYFTNVVVGDPVKGQAIWGNINSIAGFAIACLAPVLGAIADSGGRRKPWLAVFVGIMAPATFALWWAVPGPEGLSIVTIATLIVIVSVAFAFSEVFHNSMLPSVAPNDRIGFLSGLGLALGNAGGLLILCFMLYAFMLPGRVSWGFIPDHALFGIDVSTYQNSRIAGPIAGLWLFFFTLPLMFFTPDRPREARPGLADSIRQGGARVVKTVRQLKHYRNVATYLIARMFYNDGQTAILIFGGVYAAGVFHWDALTLTIYGIVLSIFAVGGGFFGGWLDDTFGSKTAILVSIGGTSLGLLLAVSITPTELFFFFPWDADAPKVWDLPFFATVPELLYVGVVVLIAIFITAAYANSRTMLARLAPATKMSEFFGLYALSGTATAFLGPAIVGFTTSFFQSQRVGFASVLVLLGVGLGLVLFVKEERAEAAE